MSRTPNLKPHKRVRATVTVKAEAPVEADVTITAIVPRNASKATIEAALVRRALSTLPTYRPTWRVTALPASTLGSTVGPTTTLPDP